jgi:hypothetical protein
MLTAMAAERRALSRRIGDKSRYLASIIDQRFDVVTSPALEEADAADRIKSAELAAWVDEAAAERAETEAKIAAAESDLAATKSVNGHALRRYLTVKSKIASATASMVSESAKVARERQETSQPVSEEGIEAAAETLAKLEEELAEVVAGHGSDLVERAARLGDIGRDLAERKAQLSGLEGNLASRRMIAQEYADGRRERLVNAVVSAILRDPSTGRDLLPENDQLRSRLVRFADENAGIREDVDRSEALEAQAAVASAKMRNSGEAIRALAASHWIETCGRFPGLSDDEVLKLATAYDEALIDKVAQFCERHWIPSQWGLDEALLQARKTHHDSHVHLGHNAFNRN